MILHYKGFDSCVASCDHVHVICGEVIGKRDTIVFQAGSFNDLENTFRASVEDYLATCVRFGVAPDMTLVRGDRALAVNLNSSRIKRWQKAWDQAGIIEKFRQAAKRAEEIAELEATCEPLPGTQEAATGLVYA